MAYKVIGFESAQPSPEIQAQPSPESKVQPQEQAQEGFGQSALRNLLRSDVRILESLLGTPGDIASGALGLGNIAAEKLTGSRPFPEKVSFLPTSEDVREKIKGFTDVVAPEYTLPQTANEKSADEFFGDLTSILHPIGGSVSGARFATGLASAGLGNLAKIAAKKLNFGPTAQEGIKVGTMLATSFGAGPTLRNQAKNFYTKAEELLPVGTPVTAAPIKETINKFEKTLSRGSRTPSKEFITSRLGELEKSINPTNNTIPVEDAYQFIKDINEFFGENKIPIKSQAFAGELIDNLKKSIVTLNKSHPDFVQSFQAGSDLYKNVNSASTINNYIQKIANTAIKKFTSPLTPYFFGLPTAIAGTVGAGITKITANAIDNIFKSPTARSIYIKALGSAAKSQAAPTARYIKQFDKIVSKEEPKIDKKAVEEKPRYKVIGYE